MDIPQGFRDGVALVTLLNADELDDFAALRTDLAYRDPDQTITGLTVLSHRLLLLLVKLSKVDELGLEAASALTDAELRTDAGDALSIQTASIEQLLLDNEG